MNYLLDTHAFIWWNDNSPKEVKIFTVSADMEGAEFHTDLTYSSTQKSADKKP